VTAVPDIVTIFYISAVLFTISKKMLTIRQLLDTMDRMKDGEFIRQMRLKKGLTQEELGESLNVKKSTISRWESGERRITLENIRNIAQALGFPLSALEHGEDYQPRNSHRTSADENIYEVIQEDTGDFASDGIQITISGIEDPELIQILEGLNELGKLPKDDLEDIKDILKLTRRIIEKQTHTS